MTYDLDAISTPSDDAYFDSHFVYAPARIQDRIARFAPAPSHILDFGCGLGLMSLAIAQAYPQAQVIGIDIHDDFKAVGDYARNRLKQELPANLRFERITPGAPLDQLPQFDVIFSWSVMEHVSRADLPPVLADLRAHLTPQGMLFTQICPLYHSPFGSHLGNYISDPWLHLDLSHAELRTRLGASGVTNPPPRKRAMDVRTA